MGVNSARLRQTNEKVVYSESFKFTTKVIEDFKQLGLYNN